LARHLSRPDGPNSRKLWQASRDPVDVAAPLRPCSVEEAKQIAETLIDQLIDETPHWKSLRTEGAASLNESACCWPSFLIRIRWQQVLIYERYRREDKFPVWSVSREHCHEFPDRRIEHTRSIHGDHLHLFFLRQIATDHEYAGHFDGPLVRGSWVACRPKRNAQLYDPLMWIIIISSERGRSLYRNLSPRNKGLRCRLYDYFADPERAKLQWGDLHLSSGFRFLYGSRSIPHTRPQEESGHCS
jgi:hypothetical protein